MIHLRSAYREYLTWPQHSLTFKQWVKVTYIHL